MILEPVSSRYKVGIFSKFQLVAKTMKKKGKEWVTQCITKGVTTLDGICVSILRNSLLNFQSWCENRIGENETKDKQRGEDKLK